MKYYSMLWSTAMTCFLFHWRFGSVEFINATEHLHVTRKFAIRISFLCSEQNASVLVWWCIVQNRQVVERVIIRCGAFSGASLMNLVKRDETTQLNKVTDVYIQTDKNRLSEHARSWTMVKTDSHPDVVYSESANYSTTWPEFYVIRRMYRLY